ncbi:MAG: PASTA domain-containing protein [Bacteroidales bacterium]|nr:PASTA domain-containing protein [Bacteroidales bacterium]
MNTENIIAYIKKLVSYIRGHIVLRNLVLAFFILIIGTAIIMQVLKWYTRHNHNLSVPDFSGLNLDEAVKVAQGRDLRLEVFDSVFLADFERGTVVEQHPRAGFMVKKNRKIFLTMNAMNPDRVAMPNLVDLTFIQARAKLESFGLKVGRISYEPNIGQNMVLAQRLLGENLPPGDSVVKGAKIDLVLGKGLSDEETAVPSLLGMSLEAANILASERFLSIGAAVRDQSVVNPEDEQMAVVFRQKPEPGDGTTLPMGSSIDVWITLDSTKVPVFSQYSDTLSSE